MERKVAPGLGVLSCIGNDVSTFWNNLINAVCGIDYITEYPTENLRLVKIGGMVRLQPRGLRHGQALHPQAGPVHRLRDGLQAWQAMKDSGSCPARTSRPKRLATYVGSGIGGFQTIQREVEKFTEDPSGKWISPNFVPTMISDMAEGRSPSSSTPAARASTS